MSVSYFQISPVCHSTDNVACKVVDGLEIIRRVLLRRYFGSERCVVELRLLTCVESKLIKLGPIRSLYKSRGTSIS